MNQFEDGRASLAEMRRLWWSVLANLLRRVKLSNASAEMLGTSRQFLKDSGYTGPVNSPKVRKELEALRLGYLAGLTAALARGETSATLLQEVRLCLEENERQQDQIEAAARLQAIPAQMPFKVLQ